MLQELWRGVYNFNGEGQHGMVKFLIVSYTWHVEKWRKISDSCNFSSFRKHKVIHLEVLSVLWYGYFLEVKLWGLR